MITFEEVVTALPLLSTEQRLMLLEEIARLLLLDLRPERNYLADAPIIRELSGILSPDVSVEDYWRHIDEKYGQGFTPETV